jgi:uncharacterized membrane protein YhhN
MDYKLLIFALIFVVPFVVLLPVYLLTEHRIGREPRGFKRATALKVTLSGLCTLCAVLGFIIWGVHDEPVRVFIPIALMCAVVGDYFMQFIRLDEKKLAIGVFFFALTQIFLVVFLCLHYGVSWPEFAIAAGIIALALVLMVIQKWDLGKVKWPLIGYSLVLAFMVSKAILPLFGGTGVTAQTVLLAAGAVLFIISDIRLATKNFSDRKVTGPKLHLIPYFCALLLIALSSLPFQGL